MPRFTRAELESFRDAEVPDLLGPDVRLLFVGINPGLWTAATQTHFAHPVNRFYPALLRAGHHRPPHRPRRRDDRRGPGPPAGARHRHHQPRPPRDRPGRRAHRRELREGGERLGGLVGRASAPGRRGRRDHGLPPGLRRPQGRGRPPARAAGGAELWVVPNPSGLNAHDTVATLAAAYAEPARAAGVLD